MICLKVKDKEFAESFRETLVKIGIYPSLYFYPKTKSKRKFRHANGDWTVTAYCKPFYVWYKSLTMDDTYQIVKEYPVGFLKGFYESEGSYFHYESVRHNQYQLYVVNTNLKLLKIVREFFTSFDFKTWWSEKTLPSEKTLYKISLKGGKKEVARFFDLINPCIKKEKIKIKLTCPTCGKEFIPQHNRQHYCSQQCCKPEIKRRCVVCGQEFTSKSFRKTCSGECSKLNARKHMREYMQEYYDKNKEHLRKYMREYAHRRRGIPTFASSKCLLCG